MVPDRSHGRTPAVQLLIDERNALIREAGTFYPASVIARWRGNCSSHWRGIAMAAGVGIAPRQRARRSTGANWCRRCGFCYERSTRSRPTDSSGGAGAVPNANPVRVCRSPLLVAHQPIDDGAHRDHPRRWRCPWPITNNPTRLERFYAQLASEDGGDQHSRPHSRTRKPATIFRWHAPPAAV